MANESSVLVRLRLLGASAFSRDAKAAGRSLGTIEGTSARAARGLGGVNKMLGVAGVAAAGFGAAAGVAAGAGIASSIKAGANFEQTMANVQARLLTSKANMELLSQQALDLGAKTSFSAQQSAQAMDEFAAAGFSVQEIMKIMPGTLGLAAASGTDLAFAAETTGALIRQFGLGAGDASHVADLLTVAVNKSAIGMDDLALTMKYVGPVAGRFNQSIEDMGASAAILGNVGIKGETAGTTLRRALVNLVRPSKRTVDVLDSMGISQTQMSRATVDASGKLRPLPQILGNLAGKFDDLSAPDRRKALAQLFGVEALPGMITLMDMGEDKINEMAGGLRNSDGAWKRTSKIMRGTVKGAWDQFTGAIETAQIRLTRGFNPVIRDTLKRMAGGVSTISDFMGGLAAGVAGKGAKGKAGGIGAQIAAGFKAGAGGKGKAETAGFQGVGAVAVQVGAKLRELGTIALDAGRQLLDAFKPAMPFLQNILLPLLKGIAIGVLGGVVMAFKIAVPVIKILATALGWVGTIARPFRGVFEGIGMVIGTLAGGPILGFLGKLRYVGVLFKILRVPIQVATGLFRAVIGVVGRLAGVFSRALTWVQRFVGTFTSGPARVVRAALNIVGSLTRILGSIPGKVVSIGGKIGRTIIDGVVAAIKAAPGAIWEAIKSLLPGGKIGEKVAGILGFNAAGGVVNTPLQVVGERGPEVTALPQGSRVLTAAQTRDAVRGSGPMSTGGEQFAAHLYIDGEHVHKAVFRRERRIVEAT